MEREYIPHIDGLRTIAVMSVFLFHLGIQGIIGGYLGVDVFFVISGYLITRILKDAAAAGSFSFFSFYARRIRRLFPALIVMTALCLLVGIAELSPLRLVELATSGIWSLLSASNFYFYLNNGYFDAAAENQIFLHTWSLALEEQFYLIWPIIIYLLVSLIASRGQLVFIVILCLFGTQLSFWATAIDPSMAFYMMPFRTAEFALGALLCWLPSLGLNRWFTELVAAIAFSALILSLLLIEGSDNFPGTIVLIPAVATSALIYFGHQSKLVETTLSNRLSTYLGRISYSLYLYHWPVIVFYKNHTMKPLLPTDQFIIFFVATALAIASYHFVEKPLRRSSQFWPDSKRVALVFCSGVALVAAAFSYLVREDGLPQRIPEKFRAVITDVEKEKGSRFELYREMCGQRGWDDCDALSDDKKNVIILGDSHGPDALNILKPFWPDAHYVLMSANGCPPMTLVDFERLVTKKASQYDSCLDNTEKLSSADTFENVDMLVLSAQFSWYTPAEFDQFLSAANLPSHVELIIFEQAPSFTDDIPDIVFSFTKPFGLERYTAQFIEPNTWSYRDTLQEIASKWNATLLPKTSFFCGRGRGECRLFYGEENKLLTYDRHHLSVASAYELGAYLKTKFPSLVHN
ncbi:MAG: acyltransferase [Halieaceae bacterium]|nr:MAG: acyltransferase [Halieaceae bacterium]|tara:strand:+ start:360 stop:2261 length:1902 start_codon:yes stop_codon:yes gene_type:complete